jgi:hypothetical protein
MEPYVFIILVNYNGFEDTVECIKSIKKNEYKNYKIIVVDNASTDLSGGKLLRLYEKDEKVHVLESHCNGGFSAGNNIGIHYAKKNGADYVMLLNNDTSVDRHFLSEIVNVAISGDKPAIYTGKILYYYEPEKIWYAGGLYSKWKGTASHIGVGQVDNGQFETKRSIDFCCGCYLFMNINLFNKLGELSEEFYLYSEDVDYSLRAKENGIQIIYCPQSFIYHKISAATSQISDVVQYYMVRNRFLVIKKHHRALYKISAYIFSLLWCIKRVLKRELSVLIIKEGLGDFMKGNYEKKGG